jgi:hypothetical protein
MPAKLVRTSAGRESCSIKVAKFLKQLSDNWLLRIYFMDLMKFLDKNVTSKRFQTEIKVSEVSKTQKMNIEKYLSCWSMRTFILFFVFHFDFVIIPILVTCEASIALKAPLCFAMIHPLISIVFYKLYP